MKILISVAGNESIVIALPVEHAGVAASLLAHATVYEKDGYYSLSGWKLAEKGVQIVYGDAAHLEPTHPKVAEANAALEKKNVEWYAEYRKREAAEKELAETKAALTALQAVTVCTQVTPEPEAEEVETEDDEA